MKSYDMEALNSEKFVAFIESREDVDHYGDVGKIHFCKSMNGKDRVGIEFSDGSMQTYEGDIKFDHHLPPWLISNGTLMCRFFKRNDEVHLNTLKLNYDRESRENAGDWTDERLQNQYFALFGEELELPSNE